MIETLYPFVMLAIFLVLAFFLVRNWISAFRDVVKSITESFADASRPARKAAQTASPLQFSGTPPASSTGHRGPMAGGVASAAAISQMGPPPPADEPVAVDPHDAGAIKDQSRQAIVFRQHFPPQTGPDVLSFFGGQPQSRVMFDWPRSRCADGTVKPLTFIMQINCADIPPQARLGLMPDYGLLYLFMDLEHRGDMPFRFIYQEAASGDATPLPTPPDLPTAFGEQGAYIWPHIQAPLHCPVSLPRWSFTPAALDLSSIIYDPDIAEESGVYLWQGGPAAAQQLLNIQGDPVNSAPFTAQEFRGPDGQIRRPFDGFPHDWGALQTLGAMLLDHTRRWIKYPNSAPLRDLSDEAKVARLSSLQAGARKLYADAAARDSSAALSAPYRDQVWAYLAQYGEPILHVLPRALAYSLEWSLSSQSESLAAVPRYMLDRVHHRHALATIYQDKIHANTPDRMLSPPVDVQGGCWDWAADRLLLLELSSNEGLGHYFGEGVYQVSYLAGRSQSAAL